MQIFKAIKLNVVSILPLIFMSSAALAQDAPLETRTADQCFEAKDQKCLEDMYADVVRNPTDDKKKAIYLLGLLKLEAGEDLESAKDVFMQSLIFGGEAQSVDSLKQIRKLYERGDIKFDSAECTIIKEDACFERIIEGDDPVKARNASYLLGKRIYETDPKRSFKLFTAAIEAGHKSATCELASFYADDEEKDGVPEDYHQSIEYGLKCLFNPPFKKFNPDHFAKYSLKEGHKAYVLNGAGYASFTSDRISPEIAARHALIYCQTGSKTPEGAKNCSVINVDGKWVKDPKLADANKAVTGVDGLVTKAGLKSYKTKYVNQKNPKVFAQSPVGAWQWSGKNDADNSLEDLKARVLAACNKNNAVIKTKKPCKIVNVNGEWESEEAPAETQTADQCSKSKDQKDQKCLEYMYTERLMKPAAVKSYTEKYAAIKTEKVFVYSPNATWWWEANGDRSLTIEALKKLALKVCNEKEAALSSPKPCEIININGKWQPFTFEKI